MPRIPDSIGKYKVETLIAKGGMGAVYKAIHPTLNRPVIIKKLDLRGRKDITERFKREARILMDFRHDGIVNMYDHFKIGTSYYIVLEFIDGKALDQVIREQRYLDNTTTAYILYQTALALSYAHSKKVIHRDIKPANLLLSKKGEVKLVDFGIAVSDEDSEKGLTKEGMSLGTPGYMAPEQFRDSKNVDQRADIYAFGVLAYEMLTGKKPFPGTFTAELVASIQKGKYANPRRYNPRISPMLLRIIKKAMRPSPEKRYNTLAPVIKKLGRFLRKYNMEELKKVVSDLASGKEPEKPKPAKKKRVVIKVALIGAGLVAVLVLGGICYYTGIHNELLHPGSYGGVVFNIRMSNIVQPANKIFINATIYKEGKKLIRIENRRIIFRRVRKKGNRKSYYFRSFPVFVRTGSYRAKLNIEDSLNWYSFVVSSEGHRPNLSRKRVINIDKYPTEQVPVTVNIKPINIITEEPITDFINIDLYQKGKWVNITEAGPIFPGEIYSFRVRGKMYYTKYFSTMIKKGQRDLDIIIGLVPIPGILILERENDRISFRLNGNNLIISAEKIPKELDLNITKKFKGRIPPGEYTLDIIYKKKRKSIHVKIEAKKEVYVVASVDQKTGEIKFLIKQNS